MADKAIVDRIKARELARPQGLLDAIGVNPEAVAAGLEFLVTDFRWAAEQYIEAKLRGGKALADDYRAAAAKLQLLAVQLRKPADKAAAEAKRLPTEWCGQHHVHGPHEYARVGIGDRACSGYKPTDTTGLDRLVADRAIAAGATPAVQVALASVAKGAAAAAQQEARDAVPQIPVFIDPALPIEPMPAEVAGIGAVSPDAWAYAVAGAAVAADRAAGVVEPAFVEPTGPGAREVPGARISWEDLSGVMDTFRRGPETAMEGFGLPEFLSHSQVETLADCGTKYLLRYGRKELGVVQVPQWALIGGLGFHAAVEWFELLMAEVKSLQFVVDRVALAGGCEAIWKERFAATVGDVAIANPEMPMDTWRASKRGLEGWSWWLINGEEMFKRYVLARYAELEAPWRLIRSTLGALPLACPECGCTREQNTACEDSWHTKTVMVEHEYTFDVDGVPFKGVIDQVWNITAPHGTMQPGDILIDDAKSGAKVPGETGQLGEYALWLSRFGGGQDRRIWGRFYDARKGTWSEPIDLLARHSWERFAFEVTAADRQKRAGIFTPRPSNFCGGCPVKHACPIFATQGAS